MEEALTLAQEVYVTDLIILVKQFCLFGDETGPQVLREPGEELVLSAFRVPLEEFESLPGFFVHVPGRFALQILRQLVDEGVQLLYVTVVFVVQLLP